MSQYYVKFCFGFKTKLYYLLMTEITLLRDSCMFHSFALFGISVILVCKLMSPKESMAYGVDLRVFDVVPVF